MASIIGSFMTLDEVAARFAEDKFATNAGCKLVSCAYGEAVCEMEVTPDHLNGMGNVMGGAIFTLADFALAVASNYDVASTVSVSNTIEYLSGVKGTKLIAKASVDKDGRTLGFYTVDVTDDTGRAIAKMTATCCRVG